MIEIHFQSQKFILLLPALAQILSIQQLYRISTMYWDDKYGTHSVSLDVSALSTSQLPATT